ATINGAHVPAVIAERSTRRVLTTVLADGVSLAASEPATRDRAGQVIFRACFELMWRRCVYNADPHPGNYLVARDGSVTFLDFGCVRRFDRAMIETWRRLARSILDGDRDGFAAGFRALGFVGKEKGFDWDYQWNAMRFLYTPFLERGFRHNPAFVAKSFGVLMFDGVHQELAADARCALRLVRAVGRRGHAGCRTAERGDCVHAQHHLERYR